MAVQGLSEKAAANSAAVTDGRYDTALPVSEAKGAEVVVDLGEERELNTVLVKWGGNYAKGYVLEASCDGTSWSSVYEKKKGGGGTDTIVLEESIRCRYLRISDVNLAGKLDGQLVELEAYGDQTISGQELSQGFGDGEFTIETAPQNVAGEGMDAASEAPEKQVLSTGIWYGLAALAAVLLLVGIAVGKSQKKKRAAKKAAAADAETRKREA